MKQEVSIEKIDNYYLIEYEDFPIKEKIIKYGIEETIKWIKGYFFNSLEKGKRDFPIIIIDYPSFIIKEREVDYFKKNVKYRELLEELTKIIKIEEKPYKLKLIKKGEKNERRSTNNNAKSK